MGSSNSRLGVGKGGSRPALPSRPHNHSHNHRRLQRRSPSFKRTLTSLLICGSSSSSNPRHEMEDDPAEILVTSAEHGDLEKIEFPAKSSSLSADTGSEYSNLRDETSVSSERGMFLSQDSSREDAPGNLESGDKLERSPTNNELFFTSRPMANCKNNETASTSYQDAPSPEPLCVSGRVNTEVVSSGRLINGGVPQNCAGSEQSNCPSPDGLGASPDEVSVENHENEMMVFHNCDSGSASVLSDAPTENAFMEASSSGLGSFVLEREQNRRDGNVIQVDVVSVSSNLSSSSSAELNSHDPRRSSRRLFWDAFSRRSSRRNADSRTFVFANDDDALGSRDRWLLDFNGDMFDDGIGGDSRFYGSSNQNTNERRWNSSSEVWERFRDVGQNGSDRQASMCPSGIHPDGTCSCGSILRTEESGARASISRIVMLAEALFEVLDEIHRQPLSLSLSMVSLPAPESVVDSLPVKNHMKSGKAESGDDVAQCYICLAEYEDGDKIRTLPCRHEYHLLCIDKWLKEIHGVCPLCRRDVREGFSEGSVSG